MKVALKIEEWRKSHESAIREIKFTLHLLRQNKLTVVGFLMFMAFIVIAILADFVAPYSPYDLDLSRKFLLPSWEHFFGTDELGRDIFSRVVHGTRISLMVGIFVVVVSMTIGVLVGAIAGFYSGKTDELIMRVTDIFLAFPSLILALAIGTALGPGIQNAMIALAVTWWPWYARLVRGQVLSIRETQYIEAARSVGGGDLHIIIKHVLPNCVAPVIVNASMDMGYVIITAASLGFLGVGAQPPMPEWGLMISIGRLYAIDYWWLSTFPGLAIIFAVLAFNLVGDGLRDVLDPRLRRFGR